jgi:DNA (cytosine-5)-methyltransferase 1
MARQSAATIFLTERQAELFEVAVSEAPHIENFSRKGNTLWRSILRRDGGLSKSSVTAHKAGSSGDLAADFDLGWLRAGGTPLPVSCRRTVRIADLFAGCGAMSAGVREACRALELDMKSILSVEADDAKLEVYRTNFPETLAIAAPIEKLIDGELGADLTPSERKLKQEVGGLDILLGGPPCQGHSDLNNFTRRSDPRNQLILSFARSVEVFRPQHVIIENVQGIRHDKGKALSFVERHLRDLGYQVEQSLVDCSLLGVPQRRRRFFLMASLHRIADIPTIVERHTVS